jgi:hypothetical protein
MMMEYRKQGDREGEGDTRKKIFGYILISPEGIEEADIRKRLFVDKQIKEARGIINHLKKLEQTKLIKKRKERIKKKGIRNIWEINDNFKNQKEFYETIELAFTHYTNPYINNFLRKNQSMIQEEFLNFLGVSITNTDIREKILLMLRYSSTVFSELIFKIIPYIKSKYENIENSGTKEHIGDAVTKYINILEIIFFEDLSSLPLAHIKESDFEEFKVVFKWEKKSAEGDHSEYSHEITQKIRIVYFHNEQDVTILLEQPKIFDHEPRE